jgi:hypothetical protein
MARIGAFNILSSGITFIEALLAKLGLQTKNGLPIGRGIDQPLAWTAPLTNGQILIGNSSGTGTPTLGTITGSGGTTVLNSAGSIDVATPDIGAETQFGLPIGAGIGNPIFWTAPPDAGQLLIGTSLTSNPVLNTLTPGTGITITNGPGTIKITATGATGGFSWSTVSTATPILPNNGYIVNGVGGVVVLTISGVAVPGDIIEVVGNNRLWSITGSGTLNIVVSQGTTLTSTTGYDTITLVCVAGPNNYVATATQGNITVA